MGLRTILPHALSLLTVATFISGCADPRSSDEAPLNISGPPPAMVDGHDHAGEHQGPHDGHVIELGRNHEYHAEMVENDDAGTMTVYILDKDLKELAIDQASITMNLLVDGQAKSFELTADGANAGMASRFDATDEGLFEALHVHEATGKLRVTINDTPYSGDVEHHHHGDDEDDHGHDHPDEHNH